MRPRGVLRFPGVRKPRDRARDGSPSLLSPAPLPAVSRFAWTDGNSGEPPDMCPIHSRNCESVKTFQKLSAGTNLKIAQIRAMNRTISAAIFSGCRPFRMLSAAASVASSKDPSSAGIIWYFTLPGQQLVKPRVHLLAREVRPFILLGVEACDVRFQPFAVLEEKRNVGIYLVLKLQVAFLAKGKLVPPCVVRLVAVEMMDRQNAPLRLRQAAQFNVGRNGEKHCLWLRDSHPSQVVGRLQAHRNAVPASLVTIGPFPSVRAWDACHVWVSASNAPVATFGARGRAEVFPVCSVVVGEGRAWHGVNPCSSAVSGCACCSTKALHGEVRPPCGFLSRRP